MNKTKRLFLSVTLLTIALAAIAQGPNNTGTYYSSANGKKGAALKTALYGIIKNHSVISYDGLIDAYELTDTRPDGCVRDWYSNATNYRHGSDAGSGYHKEGDCYNREHTVPQSWFKKASPMKSDIVHVLPTDGYVNNRRSSYPLAEVGSVEWSSANRYCKLGSCKTPGYSGKVFEPNDEIKGDLARIYFYMVTCYEDRAVNWGHVFSSDKAKGFDDWYIDMLMRWSAQDPIDSVELARNEAVYIKQGNRNPYVDYPNLEEYVFGQKKDVAFSYDNYNGHGGGAIILAKPVFSPGAGTYNDEVTVSLSTPTEGAAIYYTLVKQQDPSSDSYNDGRVYLYEAPFTLTETTTVNAWAVKEDVTSAVTSATYTITTGGGNVGNDEVEIAFNSTFFNCNYSGSIASVYTENLVGTQEGITVTYSLGTSGSNRFCNDSQIRIYPHNTLTIQAESGYLCKLEFMEAKGNSKSISASTGTMNDLNWEGVAESVNFYYTGSSDHVRLAGVTVVVAHQAGIEELSSESDPSSTLWSLSGQRVSTPRSGLYIRNGQKVLLR